MKYIYSFLFLVLVHFAEAQSTLITPDGNSGGIYSKRAVSLNPNGTLPAYVLPDSGMGTRFMWIAERSALRVGTVGGTNWNAANIGAFSMDLGIENTTAGFGAISLGGNNISSNVFSFSLGVSNVSSGTRSLAVGFSNNVSGANAIGIGKSNQVVGIDAIAIGSHNKMKAINTFALGNENIVSSQNSISVGYENENTGFGSYNFGLANDSKFERSMSIGFNNAVEGFQAIGIGVGNSPKGDNSIALGAGNKTSNDKSIAIGSFSRTNGRFAISSGFGLVNNSYGTMVVGLYNDTLALNNGGKALDPDFYIPNDPIFVVGNGLNDANRSNALVVYKSSYVGINTLYPTQILDVNGSARFRSVLQDNSNNVFVTIENDGTIKKTTVNLSDRSLKQNIQPLENALEKVLALSGKSYEFKEYPNQPRIGFIAQDVETVLPEVVFENDEGLKGVRYQEIVALLTEALKEQQEQIATLKQRLNEINSVNVSANNTQK